jgi:glycosyltransferase involved in cell wall biosynthesis
MPEDICARFTGYPSIQDSDNRNRMTSSGIEVSVIVLAHNPRVDYLTKVLDALRVQSLPQERWELLIVDNQSTPPLENLVNLNWHSNAAIVREPELGITRARVCGLKQSVGWLAIFVDDDNVLAPDYLEQARKIADEFPFIGTWGGRIDPEFENVDRAPPRELHSFLSLREVSADLWSNDQSHHASTPWGPGLCIRKTVADIYLQEVEKNRARLLLGVKGNARLAGDDTDIAYTGCRMGLAKGVFCRLQVTHLIPNERCTAPYLCRVAKGRGYSAVLHNYLLPGGELCQDQLSVSRVVRFVRTLLKPKLQRSTAFAYQQGYRQAIRDLLASRAP